jgi:tRNA nucleotidyltransferase (CCA-adding enzyme)
VLVGGSVRDTLLGRPLRGPYDIATSATPEQVTALFERTVPIGVKHGTVLLVEDGLQIESTTFRRESGYRDARHPDSVEFGADLEEDLSRRDLTVNALAFDPHLGRLVDPEGGALDLEQRVLRAVGDAVERFQEDALRPLRAARLAAVLEFELAEETRRALGRVTERARQVALERVKDELDRLMAAARPSIGFELLAESGLLELWMPELAEGVGVPQNRYHAYDVFRHGLRACDAAPVEKPRVRWAALLHDVGKPRTRVDRGPDSTFYNHQFVGAEMADALLGRLCFPTAEREAIVHLVREHMFDFRPQWSDAALRRWLRRVGEGAVADLFDLRIADALARAPEAVFPAYLEQMRERVEALLRRGAALQVTDLEVDGRDVMRELGLAPGPRVGQVLHALLEAVIERPELNRRDGLLEQLRRWPVARGGAA